MTSDDAATRHATDWCVAHGPRPCSCWDDGEPTATPVDLDHLELLFLPPWTTRHPEREVPVSSSDPYAAICPCSCHVGGPWASCDEDGGCGYRHAELERETREHLTDDADRAAQAHAEARRKAERLQHLREADELARRRCARGPDCPGREVLPTSTSRTIRVGAPLVVDVGLCAPCTNITQTVIAGLVRDHDDCTTHAGATYGTTGEPVSGTPELPIPVKTALIDLAARIVTVTTTWAEPIAEARNIDFDTRDLDRELADGTLLYRPRRARATLTAAVDILEPAVDELLALPEQPVLAWAPNGEEHARCIQTGLDAALELHQLHHRVEATLGRTHLQHRLPTPCPYCACKTLVRDNGEDTVYCTRGCARWDPDRYQWLSRVAIAVERRRDEVA